MNDLQNRWDKRWQKNMSREDWQPDPWLRRIRSMLPVGRVLDVACGVGRNALYLAEQGFAVTAVDLSPEALRKLDCEAGKRGLVIKSLSIDLEAEPLLPPGPFDLIVDFFYLHRPLLPHLAERLLPGGLMALRTFSLAGPFAPGNLNSAFVLNPGELLEVFRGWDVLLHEEGLEESPKGGSVAGILARKPSSPAW